MTGVAVNDPFVAGNDNYATAEDTPLTVPANGVLANDNDPDDAPPYTVELVSGPASGSLGLLTNGGFSYTPAANTHGTVTFTYRAKAGALEGVVRSEPELASEKRSEVPSTVTRSARMSVGASNPVAAA